MKQMKNMLNNVDVVQKRHSYHTNLNSLAFHVVTMFYKASKNSLKFKKKTLSID